jgi:hypothetical protein
MVKKHSVKVTVDNADGSECSGPYLTPVSGFLPPKNVQYEGYYKERSNQQRILYGENDKMEYTLSNAGQDAQYGINSQYLVGIYDPSTKTVTFQPAPFLQMNRQVKVLKAMSGANDAAAKSYVDQVEALGQEFGTKKKRSEIAMKKKNEVDVSTMQSDLGSISSAIKVEANPDNMDPLLGHKQTLPPFNLSAKNPEDIYNLKQFFNNQVLNTLAIGKLLNCTDPKELDNLMTYPSSKFLHLHMSEYLGASGPKNKDAIKKLQLIGLLMKLYNSHRNEVSNVSKLKTMFKSCSNVGELLMEQFTETTQNFNSKANVMIPDNLKRKLACHIIIMILTLSNYQIDLAVLANDLKMDLNQATQLAYLVGCKPAGSQKGQPGQVSKVFKLVAPLQLQTENKKKRK